MTSNPFKLRLFLVTKKKKWLIIQKQVLFTTFIKVVLLAIILKKIISKLEREERDYAILVKK